MINMHGKLVGDSPMVYREPVSGAIIASAILGTATSLYASNEQKKAAEEAQRKQEEAQRAAEAEKLRILESTRAEGETVEAIDFGTMKDELGSIDNFLVERKTTSKLGSFGGSGLGFDIG